MRTELLLPYPPSVNQLFANRKRGRRKTDKYIAWIRDAGWTLRTQPHRNHQHTGPVSFTLYIRRPDDNRRRDKNNLIKAVEDLLVRHLILLDDSQIMRTHVEWVYDTINGAQVIIEDIEPIQPTPCPPRHALGSVDPITAKPRIKGRKME